jgi:hypothetical protein
VKNDYATVLKQSPIFSGLAEPELEELAGLASERSYSPAQFIFWEGDETDWFSSW